MQLFIKIFHLIYLTNTLNNWKLKSKNFVTLLSGIIRLLRLSLLQSTPLLISYTAEQASGYNKI